MNTVGRYLFCDCGMVILHPGEASLGHCERCENDRLERLAQARFDREVQAMSDRWQANARARRLNRIRSILVAR